MRTLLMLTACVLVTACGPRDRANKGYPGSTNTGTKQAAQGARSAPGANPGSVTGNIAGNGATVRDPHPQGSAQSPQEGVTGPGGTSPAGRPGAVQPAQH
ncbi:MAG TPA: hypothetical protein VFA04_22170 [Bryobacteraceae bacterium]|nr:hypothetical protein [Bryobacteraceae bacterium]